MANIVAGGGKKETIGKDAGSDGSKWKDMELETPAATQAATDEPSNPLNALFERLYGKMTWEEKLRLLWLASTLFFIIGGYWLLRSLKDPVISTVCAWNCIIFLSST